MGKFGHIARIKSVWYIAEQTHIPFKRIAQPKMSLLTKSTGEWYIEIVPNRK